MENILYYNHFKLILDKIKIDSYSRVLREMNNLTSDK